MKIIVFGMAGVYLVDAALGNSINLISYLTLNAHQVIHNFQFWRLITFIFVPPSQGLSQAFWVLISLYFYYIIGSSLESYWGGFRFNLYYLLGVLGVIASAFLTMLITPYATVSNSYINTALFLAYATIAPDSQFMLFFIIPLKAKWMALAYAFFTLVDVLRAFFTSPVFGLVSLVLLAFSLLNYFIFFGSSLVETVKNQIRIYKNRRNWRR